MNKIYIFALLLISMVFLSKETFAQIDTTIVNDSLIEKIEPINNSNIDNINKENIKQVNETKMKISDWIAGIAVIIALVALILSIITSVKTNNLANKDYLLTHRPFVWVENFGYLNNQNIIVNPINQVMIRVLNSPANFIKEYFEYYIIDNEGNKSIIENQEYENQIRYPDDKSQYTNTSSKVTKQLLATLNENQEMERIIIIDYSWLSSEKVYYFEAKWRLEKVSKTWKIITQNAD